MILRPVTYCRPDSLEEALDALRSTGGARVLAGGQTLLNVLKLRAATVDLLVDIGRLEECRGIRDRGDGSLDIGACTTYAEIEADELVRTRLPFMSAMAARLVDQQVRNRGTIGGNVCFNDPTSNFPPLLVALQATFTIAVRDGERSVPARDFFRGHHRTAVEHGAILRSITLPALEPNVGVGYQSLLIGRDSWALARAAATVRVTTTIQEVRVVLGCVGPTPVSHTALEDALLGVSPGAVDEAWAGIGIQGVEPVADAHASSEYRREMADVMARRAVREAIERVSA